jgi:hypothetical protein
LRILGFFAGFSLFIIIFAEWFSEAATGLFVLKSLKSKKTGARSARAAETH